MSPQAVGLSECLIELEGPRGKMRITYQCITWPPSTLIVCPVT
jgi:hypothetical protein